MKILVAVKRVLDYKATARIKSDGSGVDLTNVKMSMNPFDEIAVEEAERLKEKGIVTETVAVSIGQEVCQETIRTALAMGADKGVLVKTDVEIKPLAAAKILKKLAEQEDAKIVILGKQAIDSDNNQVGQMLAAMSDWSLGAFASEIIIEGEQATVTREIDGGLETLKLTLPAVITTDLRLNDPRYISLPNIVKAKKKSIDVIEAESLSLDLTPREELLKVEVPKKERGKVIVETVAELVEKLKNEAHVL